jgi:uncharacterized protein YndB with AHSA1/START domain
MRGRSIVAACALLVAASSSVGGQEVENTSYRWGDDQRVLQHRVVVQASLDDVWAAFTTTEGIRSWAVPVASVDFRLGGIWESSYDPAGRIGSSGNIRNRFISFLPLRMIATQAESAPPDFPHPEVLPEIFFVTELEPVGENAVRVTVSGVGFLDDAAHDAVYALFERGNAWSLQQLHRRFAHGPVDWSARD